MPRNFKPEIGFGIHDIRIISWRDAQSEPNPETGKGGNMYTELTVILNKETDSRRIAIFDGGLDLFCTGVIKQSGWDKNNTDTNAMLDFLVGKPLKANHYPNVDRKTGKVYRNWGWDPSKFHLTNGTAAPASSTPDDDDAPLPDIG